MNVFVKTVQTDKAPKAIGPYAQATKLGDFVYLSGQVPLNPESGKLAGDSVEEQTHQVMKNIGAILGEIGLRYDHIMKTTVFLKDLNDFAAFNEIYASYFDGQFPARSCIAVADIPAGAKVEVECLAIDTLVYEQQMAAQQGGCSSCGGCDSGSCSEC